MELARLPWGGKGYEQEIAGSKGTRTSTDLIGHIPCQDGRLPPPAPRVVPEAGRRASESVLQLRILLLLLAIGDDDGGRLLPPLGLLPLAPGQPARGGHRDLTSHLEAKASSSGWSYSSNEPLGPGHTYMEIYRVQNSMVIVTNLLAPSWQSQAWPGAVTSSTFRPSGLGKRPSNILVMDTVA